MTPLEQLPDVMRELALLCAQFPDVEIRVSIYRGDIKVGIPKGPNGDLFAAAWNCVERNVAVPLGPEGN